MADAIWLDKVVSLGTTTDTEFDITLNDEEIYRGKAYIKPGESSPSVRLNDICADYLKTTYFPMTNKAFQEAENIKTFELWKRSGALWMSVGSYEFVGDWSYDSLYTPTANNWSNPILDVLDERQWLPYSSKGAAISFKSTNKSGTTYTDSVTGSSGHNGTGVLNLAARSNIVQVVVGGHTFKVLPACHRYVFYYINAYGAWDTFLIEGEGMERDTLVRHTGRFDYPDNRDFRQRGLTNYVNEVSRGYTLHTGLLTDWQSSQMHHLLNSTNVLLHDLVTGHIMSVVITNNSWEYRTFKNNGRKFVTYTIDCELAQVRDRR